MATQQAEQSSTPITSTQVTGNTVASGGTAGSQTTDVAAGAVPVAAAVVAPKGFRLELQQMLQGWQGVIPDSSALSSSVGTLTQASVTEQLQEFLGPYTAMDAQATALKQTRVQVKAQLTAAQQYYAVLRSALRSFLGEGSPQLAQFGLKPKKTPTPLKSEELAVRVAKARVTRTLRGTKGSVQKAGIVSGPMAISVTAVAAGTSSAAPDPTVGAASPPPASGSGGK